MEEKTKKTSKGKRAAAVICALLFIALLFAAFVFRGLIWSLFTVKSDAENGIYVIDFRDDYKLDELLEQGGVKTQDELAKYIIKVLLKGLPVPIAYEVPELGCSTFNASTPTDGYVFSRNFDNQVTDLAVVKTAPKDGYRSVSVVDLSFLGYTETFTPEKLFDRVLAMGAPYFPMDGINEKGFAVGVLQIMAPPTDQNTDKPDVDTTVAIRMLLDRAATVDEAIELLSGVDMHASAGGCFHFHLSDASGNSAVVSYSENEMIITRKTGSFICATNFYLHSVPFEYDVQGKDRYDKLTETLTQKNGVLSLEEARDLLQSVSIISTEPDEVGRVYSTQWSSVYDLTNPSLTLSPDRHYDKVFTFAP
ncbi:MAG: linear amide C-N hydrolase [Clostridia bacterium]|nr:linear amide C-N hydrolase [Clostridia bacterium]